MVLISLLLICRDNNVSRKPHCARNFRKSLEVENFEKKNIKRYVDQIMNRSNCHQIPLPKLVGATKVFYKLSWVLTEWIQIIVFSSNGLTTKSSPMMFPRVRIFSMSKFKVLHSLQFNFVYYYSFALNLRTQRCF